jgi:hypothetical protein
LRQRLTCRRQLLDSVVACIGHLDVARPIDRNALRIVELTRPSAPRSQLLLRTACRRNFSIRLLPVSATDTAPCWSMATSPLGALSRRHSAGGSPVGESF